MGKHGIDPHSDVSLYDVLNTDLVPGEDPAFEYYGFFIQPLGDGKYSVQYDGHVGSVHSFHRDDYDDVLELVADLNDCLIKLHHHDYQDDKDGLVEWAGKIWTEDRERYEENPEHYIYRPDQSMREEYEEHF